MTAFYIREAVFVIFGFLVAAIGLRQFPRSPIRRDVQGSLAEMINSSDCVGMFASVGSLCDQATKR